MVVVLCALSILVFVIVSLLLSFYVYVDRITAIDTWLTIILLEGMLIF